MKQEEKTLDERCSFEHKWKIARGYISNITLYSRDNPMCKV